MFGINNKLYLILKGDWIKDGFCDDSNNNDACDYDGGDCCGLSARKKFCIDCTCKGKLISSQLLKETDLIILYCQYLCVKMMMTVLERLVPSPNGL